MNTCNTNERPVYKYCLFVSLFVIWFPFWFVYTPLELVSWYICDHRKLAVTLRRMICLVFLRLWKRGKKCDEDDCVSSKYTLIIWIKTVSLGKIRPPADAYISLDTQSNALSPLNCKHQFENHTVFSMFYLWPSSDRQPRAKRLLYCHDRIVILIFLSSVSKTCASKQQHNFIYFPFTKHCHL